MAMDCRPSDIADAAPPSMSIKRRLNRLGHSFRESAHHIRDQSLARVRKVPTWVRILNKAYHQYGLKHALLICILAIYLFLGAVIFYYCEAGADFEKERTWNMTIAHNRTNFVNEIIPLLFNNTKYLFFLNSEQTEEISEQLHFEVAQYERQLGIRYTDQKIRWDFWNAMLYAQTLCTTIGYGHLYPSTVPGRVFTMIYAIFGIPLVLSILDDLGKVLTKCLKSPWWLLKCGCRRAFRYCTKQTLEEIRRLDEEDKRDLEIFDLPVPIAIIVVISWIFFCSATFCLWEHDWDYFIAFYFFFISLSTIGLGDITPTQPKYLLVHFMYIIIGLSLVSMCINLIQAKLERTYEAGGAQRFNNMEFDRKGGILLDSNGKVRRRGSSLGVFRSSSSAHSLTRETVQAALAGRRKVNKTCQTILSFPSPSSTNASIARSVSHSRARFIPRSLSIDDVMRMVDSEDGDIIVLTDLVREESGISQTSQISSASCEDSTSSHIVVSKSFDTDFCALVRQTPRTMGTEAGRIVASRPSVTSINEIEAMEEMEDRVALAQSSAIVNSVHFRSRLSLIPEQLPSTVEEGDEPSEESNPLSPGEESQTSRKSDRRPFHSMLSYLSRRKADREVPIS